MKLAVFKSLWGMTGSVEEQFKRVADAGYAGIESGAPGKDTAETFKKLLRDHKLQFIAMAFTGGDDHVASLKEQVENAKGFSPISLTVHSARDGWTLEKQKEYFAQALDVE